MFKHVDAYAGDPILSLMETFKADPRADKVNLSIGLYYDAAGVVPQLGAVAEAENAWPASLTRHRCTCRWKAWAAIARLSRPCCSAPVILR